MSMLAWTTFLQIFPFDSFVATSSDCTLEVSKSPLLHPKQCGNTLPTKPPTQPFYSTLEQFNCCPEGGTTKGGDFCKFPTPSPTPSATLPASTCFNPDTSSGDLNCFERCGEKNRKSYTDLKKCYVGTCDGGVCSGDKDCAIHNDQAGGGGICIGKPNSAGLCKCFPGYQGCNDCSLRDEQRALGAKCGSFPQGGGRCDSDEDCKYKGPFDTTSKAGTSARNLFCKSNKVKQAGQCGGKCLKNPGDNYGVCQCQAKMPNDRYHMVCSLAGHIWLEHEHEYGKCVLVLAYSICICHVHVNVHDTVHVRVRVHSNGTLNSKL
jgi:hypothetical protein